MKREWVHCRPHRGTTQLLSAGDILVLIRACPPGRDNHRFRLSRTATAGATQVGAHDPC